MGLAWLCVVSLLFVCQEPTSAAYTPCIAVQDRQIVCLGPGFAFQHTFTIACPVGHSPYIHDARYRIHDESRCPTSIDSYSCDAEDLQKRFRDECSRASGPCQVVVQYNPKHFCEPEKTGTHFVEVKVECVAGVNSEESNIITLCDKRIHNGPYVSLHSKLPSGEGNGRAIKGTSCFCALTVPPNSKVAITAESMVKSPPPPPSPAHQCDQKVSIQAFKFSQKFLPICQQDDPTSLDKRILEMTCGTELYRTVLVKYESSDRTVGTSFILKFNASYTAPFWLQCGLTAEQQIVPVWESTSTAKIYSTSTTTTSPNPSISTVSPNPASRGSSEDKTELYIIIGVSIGVAVVLVALIILAVVLYRRRHPRAPPQPPPIVPARSFKTHKPPVVPPRIPLDGQTSLNRQTSMTATPDLLSDTSSVLNPNHNELADFTYAYAPIGHLAQ